MPARTGAQYIAGLQKNPPNIYIGGKRIEDVTSHPGLRNGAATLARLYDMQHDPALRDEMTSFRPPPGTGLVYHLSPPAASKTWKSAGA